MQVFKFGGASVSNYEKVQNLGRIVQQFPDEQLMIVISAMGKTTNALEKVAEAFFAGKKEEALQLFRAVKLQHLDEAKYLLVTHFNPLMEQFNNFFTEVEWLLYDQPVREYDYYYDQIVCLGELLLPRGPAYPYKVKSQSFEFDRFVRRPVIHRRREFPCRRWPA